MSNNERFNALINSCENPRLMLSMLMLIFQPVKKEIKGGVQA